MSRIYWDTMLFIYWLEENPQFGKRVDAIWSRMQERNDQLITGALALGEVFAGAYKRGADKERIQEVKAALENAVSAVIPFTAETADVYGRIKGSLKIPSADAIHLACAATAGTDLFLTNDKSLVGKVIPGIQFIAGLDSNII
ncbi:PilT protein domain protein [Candidatus Sulfotelmatobacter kueseliae]|uniref:PilT protein domain protein n=1 Tax=Candidatus Sulfotelmatobacter kueseliae TaxID=2042962 RepID=A0A2U3JZH8_9BACT|nr:PilT protein domain protein [Candidatus Sulfotelmatobacter kueseliae]